MIIERGILFLSIDAALSFALVSFMSLHHDGDFLVN